MKWVLLVDDEPHVTRLMRKRLERCGFGVDVSPNGEVALEKLASRRFDAMVTDVTMPRMDGIQLCEEVRKSSLNEDLFIIVATSRAQPELREWAERIDQLEFMEKPISLIDLSDRLEQRLGLTGDGGSKT